LVRGHTRLQEYNDYYKIILDEYIVGGVVVATHSEKVKEFKMIFVDPEYKDQGLDETAIKLIIRMYPNTELWTSGAPDWNNILNNLLQNSGFRLVGTCIEAKGQITNWYHRTKDDQVLYTPIGELKDGMKNLNVRGKILEKATARTVRGRRRGETLSVTETGLVDDTGRVVLTLWNEQIKYIRVGDEVLVEDGYVSSYRGIKQLSVGRSGRIIKQT
jgi:hypothetical protein